MNLTFVLPEKPAVIPALCLGIAVLSSLLCQADDLQKKTVTDFEDAGTWRVLEPKGLKPGSWFSGNTFLEGSENESCHDDRVGEIRFAFDPESSPPYRIQFRRSKMALTEGFLRGIEFEANAGSLPVSIAFLLRDMDDKPFTTSAIRLAGEGWQHYALPLGPETVPSWSKARPPLRLEQVVLQAEEPCAGSVYLDDITLTGQFASDQQFTITPVYEGIYQSPDKPIRLRYRVRNALASPVTAKIQARVRSYDGQLSPREQTQEVVVDAYGSTETLFNFPPLPIGAYVAEIKAVYPQGEALYEDTFIVIRPNNGRLNRLPMWFGVQDTFIWNGPHEKQLHLDWMRALGVDLVRVELTGGSRFQPELPSSLEPWTELIGTLEAENIDVLLLYNGLPPDMAKDENPRSSLAKPMAFEAYAAQIGSYFGQFTNVSYIEFWNEPDIHFFQGTTEEYWEMFEVFARGVRSTAPHIMLTTGGATVSHPREKPGFSQSLYSTHGDLYDIAAFHSHGPLNSYQRLQGVVETWQREGGINNPIANTESGERSGYTPELRLRQAITLVKKMAWSKSRPQSEFNIWFTLQDFWDMDPKVDDSFGLVTSDNRAKPSFAAYNELIRQLANSDPVVPAPVFPAGVSGQAFHREDGNEVLVCWAEDGTGGGTLWFRSKHDLLLVDMFGRETPLSATSAGMVTIGKEPVYLISPESLEFLQPDELPLVAPVDIYRDPAAPASFPVRVRNTGEIASTHLIVLSDASGNELWRSDLLRLEPGRQEDLIITVPASPSSAMTTLPYLLEMTDPQNQTPPVVLPVKVHGSYSIAADTAMPIILDTVESIHEIAFDPKIQPWTGPEDLSVQALVSREKNSILFRFIVTDDRHVQTHDKGKLWMGDSVQVAFYNPANDAHTLFDLAMRQDKSIAWCHKNSDPALMGLWTIPLSIRREGNQTIYEARVPFDHLGLDDALGDEGQPVRFAFLVNEDDGQGRVRWIRWRGGLGDSTEIDPLGHAILK